MFKKKIYKMENNINNRSYKTAIKRKRLSLPAKFLSSQNLLKGRTIDFGCGKGYDSDALGLEKYDPYYSPIMPAGKFDTVMSNYVANVLTNEEITTYLNDIRTILKPEGKAYLTVRRDIKTEGYTKKGTYQTNRKLDLPVLKRRKRAFCIYVLEK